jgi:hypothetical protein
MGFSDSCDIALLQREKIESALIPESVLKGN